ncbi:MAG: hypothetical protein B6D41_05390 [Chloroflexi bacterium UTCFX4]|nr:MAG: hypothetical protein B6D41_05390 [Chloroflexi bacterium UTCFX4]
MSNAFVSAGVRPDFGNRLRRIKDRVRSSAARQPERKSAAADLRERPQGCFVGLLRANLIRPKA